LQEYTAAELENEIFTLHEIVQPKGAKLKRKESKEGTQGGKKQEKQQIILNEK